MKTMLTTVTSVLSAMAITLISAPGQVAHGQDAEAIEEVVVTGSRIRRNPLDEAAAIMEVGRSDLERTGLTRCRICR